METSPTISALADALAKAQGAVEGAVKGRVNPAFRSKYADLASVWDACREALTQNGLSVIQSPGEVADGRMRMTTMLLHSSGEWVRDSLTIPLGKVDAQGFGSATTYARRFALAAFVGVAPEDDDGNAAVKAKPAPKAETDNTLPPVVGRADVYETVGRKSAAQAKRDGDHDKINTEVAGLDLEGVRDWYENFDSYTAHLPASWLDPIRDKLELRREELMTPPPAEASDMDEAFRQTVGPGGVRGLAGHASHMAAE
jgi:hypothetical protein